MLFPVSKLMEGHGELLCVPRDTKVSDALALMVEHDYTQLPIVDQNGNLSGIISESSIVSTYYCTGGAVSLLDLTVDHCQTSPATISPENDIFEALDLLTNVYAIVVVEEQKPVGILTYYDMTEFFNDISEGLIIVQDIEVALRNYIEKVFDTEKKMDAALMKAFKADKQDPTRPAREYEGLSFGRHIQLIVTEGNWHRFQEVLEPKELFQQLMDQVGQIRNQLAHFRGSLDPVQRHALLRARDWLSGRPKLSLPSEAPEELHHVSAAEVPTERPTGKYTPLGDWLKKQQAKNIRVSFQDIEVLLGEPLPASARKHRSWWSNDPDSHTQALAWMRAGWRAEDVDQTTETVIFKRTDSVLNHLFFADLLTRLKKARPGVTRATKTFPASWWGFSAGKTGVNLNWSLRRDGTLWVELYIDTGDKVNNKALYDKLAEQKDAIEQEIGQALNWDRLDPHQASRITLSRSAKITDPPDQLEQTKQWAIETMLKFVDTFQPRIKEL